MSLMEYSESLADRVRSSLAGQPDVTEAALLSGKSFWVADRLVISINGDDLLVRVAEDDYESVLELPGTRPFEFADRPVPSWVIVEGVAIATDDELARWVNLGLEDSEAV